MRNFQNEFDCVIPVAGRDRFIVCKTIKYVFENINPNKIYIISNKEHLDFYNKRFKNDVVVILDEDKILKNLNYEKILVLLQKKFKGSITAGWYLQQFLKIGYSLSNYCSRDYIVWDADTIPINKIEIFKDSKPIFYVNDAYHQDYFDTINSILSLNKVEEKSFISEFMYIKKTLMKEMILSIKKNSLKNEEWYETIIRLIPSKNYNSFSEFETYGTFIMTLYPNTYCIGMINTYRNAGKTISRLFTKNEIHKLKKYYDILSFEHQMNSNNLKGYIDFIFKVYIYIYDKLKKYCSKIHSY